MRVKQQAATASGAAAVGATPPAQPLSPIVKRLRQMWRFAAICQFLFTFDEAFGMSGFETEALERDLDGSETQMIPDLMRRLLYTLTLNRDIDSQNWEAHLRAQYEAREPESPLLGTAEAPMSWAALPLTAKVDTIYTLCEWQLVDAERFRKLVKNDEDAQIWRIDPVGWDSQDNTYWLFDDNRLWVQHPPPPEPVKARPPKKNSKKARAEAAAAKRAAQKASGGSTTTTPSKPSPAAKRKRDSLVTASPKPRREGVRSSSRGKPVAEIPAPTPSPQKRTRRSLRGDADGWEQIPPELLYDGANGKDSSATNISNGKRSNGNAKQRGKREGSSSTDSELSEPPPLEEGKEEDGDVKMEEADAKVDLQAPPSVTNGHGGDESTIDENGQKEGEGEEEVKEEEIGNETAEKEEKEEEAKPEWVEFEAIAVSKAEWEAIATRFAKSKHPDEKAFHELLSETVIPKVMGDFAELEKQRAHEAAMASRKRSSRIALKESEREERERDRAARLAMEERMASLRREELEKANREEEERRTVKHREDRLREREERILAREREAEEKALREIHEREERERLREMRKQRREEIIANGGVPTPEPATGSEAQVQNQDGDNWELDCEVCGKAGVNLDDTDEIVCCEQCGVWQHTECWNAFDRSVQHPRRDWEREDFFCSRCRPPAPGQPWPVRPQQLPKAPLVPSQRPITSLQTSPAPPQQQQQQQQQQSMPAQVMSPNYQQQRPQSQFTTTQHIARPLEGAAAQLQSHFSHQSGPQMVSQQPVRSEVLQQPPPIQPRPMQQQSSGTGPMAQSRPSPATDSQAPTHSSTSLNGTSHLQSSSASRPAQAAASAFPPVSNPARPVVPAGPAQTPSPAPQSASQTSTPSAQTLPRVSPGGANGSSPMGAPPVAPPKSPSAKPFAHRPSQPSGSFPMRHTQTKSPLSGGHVSASTSPATGLANGPVPTMSLGPTRAVSPSPPGPKGAGTAVFGAIPPIGQQARDPNSLYSRQTPTSTPSAPSTPNVTGLTEASGSRPVTAAPGLSGSATASAARPDQERRTFGPSEPRGAFGSPAASSLLASNKQIHAPSSMNSEPKASYSPPVSSTGSSPSPSQLQQQQQQPLSGQQFSPSSSSSPVAPPPPPPQQQQSRPM